MDDLLFERLVKGSLPKGTSELTRIHTSEYYKHNFIKNCLNELTINILFNSAYIDFDKIIKERTKS